MVSWTRDGANPNMVTRHVVVVPWRLFHEDMTSHGGRLERRCHGCMPDACVLDIHRYSGNIHGHSCISMEYSWVFMDIHGICMDIHEYAWDMHGYP